MKNFYLLLILWSSLGFAQEKLSFAEGQELMKLAAEAGSEGNYEQSLEILQSIHPKDSSFCASLVPKSYYLLNSGKFEEAIAVTEDGISRDCGSLSLSFYINQVVAYINNEDLDKGLLAVEKGLDDYPRNFQLWYNKGLLLEKADKIPQAVAAYQQAIYLNPSYALPHLRLGNISYSKGLMAQAMMALNMYLILNPDGSDSFKVLTSFNDLVRTKMPTAASQGQNISGDDASFEQLNLLLENKLAFNEQYKINSKIDVALTRQNHLMLEQLAAFEEGEGFWTKVYVPLYKWVWTNNRFEDFTNVVSFSIENEDYRKIVRKDVEGLKTFRNSLLVKWSEILQSPSYRVLEEDRGLMFKYLNLRLDGIGEAEGETPSGAWKFYNSEGVLAGEGSFDREGNRTGKWVWLHDGKRISETAIYKKGSLEGSNKGYFENGRLRYSANYQNNELNGEHLVYNKKGALLERKFFKNGALEGAYRSNFPVGEVLKEFDITYRNGLVEDKAYEYYANGKVFSEMSFRGGEKNGVEKRYNRNGSLTSEVNYEANKAVGPFISYFSNGNIYERTTYKDGLFEGLYEAFYEDGSPKSTGNLKEGLYQGTVKYFDLDGKLHYEFDYKNGDIIAYRYFDKAGETLAAGKRRGGEFYYRSYSPYGQITAEGLYDTSGGKKGAWKFYSDTGVLTGEGVYTEDKANGIYTQYYETGEKFSESTYQQDTLNGYYRSFFRDGIMQSQGWYADGEEQGEWRHYYPNGTLKAKNFFHKGEFHDLQEFYGVEGELISTLSYNHGDVKTEKFYDPEGELFEELDRDTTGEYTLQLHHFDGSLSHETTYVNGIKHGIFTQYDHNGKKIEEGNFVNGEQDGTFISYYPNGNRKMLANVSRGDLHGEVLYFYEDGTPELVRNYEFGNSTGESRSFHENGKLKVLTPYFADREHGRKEFFDPEGRLELVRFYEHGRLMGYSYLDENSTELPMIPLENETGVIRSLYDNGKVSREMEYVRGEVTGTYRSYYYSGQLMYETFYKAGEYHGKSKEYYANGNLKSEKTYHFGELHGPSREYFENGQLRKEINYAFDLKHGKAETFDQQGVRLTREHYFNNNIYEADEI